MVPIWLRSAGRLDADPVTTRHPRFRPSLELYFEGAWVGLHCYREEQDGLVLDEERMEEVLRWVEAALSGWPRDHR